MHRTLCTNLDYLKLTLLILILSFLPPILPFHTYLTSFKYSYSGCPWVHHFNDILVLTMFPPSKRFRKSRTFWSSHLKRFSK
ncbi:hypothetical protein BDQ17DRAFT_1520265 [Cyathus striatus]|nr:hypothetical protein BDQ17DRAFT_1520265 [Cyathus striatus]